MNKAGKSKNAGRRARSIQAALLAAAITLAMFAAAIPLEASAAAPPAGSEALGGWQQIGGAWYYYIDGVRQTGWIEADGKDYFLSTGNGRMTTGWLTYGGNRYYLTDGSGEMVRGWLGLGGKWYYFDETGAMLRGWLQYNKNWYFMGSDGAMATGWVSADSNRYFFDPDGTMVTGWRMLNGRWHYFYGSGAMATGWLMEKGKWYYFKSDGVMASREWLRIGGVWYHFSAVGTLYSATGDGSPRLSPAQAAFVDRYQAHAAALGAQYKIPWEAVMAQGILESAAGTSSFARNRNNFFGIGAVDSNPGNARYYDSPEAGWEGYYRFIRDNGRYARQGIFREPNVTDPYEYARAVKAAGYATDPNYVSKLHYLITAVLNRAHSQGWPTSVMLGG